MSLPVQNFHPGWPSFITDEDGQEYVRIRDGSIVQEDPPLGNSVLYASLRPRTKVVEMDAQYIPLWDWQKTIRMNPGPWASSETLEAAGVPGLDPLPRGYDYVGSQGLFDE